MFYTGQVGNDPLLAEWQGSRVVFKPASSRAIVAAVEEAITAGSRRPG